jgi:long-chain acyl-CoA synthetase
MNLARNLERSAFYFPDRPMLCENSVDVSYAQFNATANKFATALLQMGIQPGDHVGLCAPNSGEWLAGYFGAIKAGAVAVTMSSMLQPDELSLLVNHCKPKIILTHDSKIDQLEKLRDDAAVQTIISPNGDISFEKLIAKGSPDFKAIDCERTDTAAILYTGGTTGLPKGVMLSHENINAAIHNVMLFERTTEKDRALLFLPFNHVFGQMHVMNASVLSAGCLELIPTFDLDQVLDILKSGRVTKFFAVPTVYVRMLTLENLKEKLGAVRYCFSAAASMAADIIRQWYDRTGLKIYEGYGMTEAAPCVTFNHYYRHVVGSIGTEVPNVEVQIRNPEGEQVPQGTEGEICVRGPNIMKGYLDNPEATREAFWENGWFRSGDVGLFDEDGYIFIVDRIKDMIITGGENVYSTEVEEVLYTHPDIQECAVVGLPDKEWGERVTAYIIPKVTADIDANALKAYAKERLSAFKVPKDFFVIDEFPRSPAGKILKRNLRKMAKEKNDNPT